MNAPGRGKNGNGWQPSRRGQAVDWWMTRFMRYVIGGGSIAWELLVDKGKNPMVLLVGAMLGSSTDVLGIVRALIAQAKMERKTLDQLMTEEMKREGRQEDSSE